MKDDAPDENQGYLIQFRLLRVVDEDGDSVTAYRTFFGDNPRAMLWLAFEPHDGNGQQLPVALDAPSMRGLAAVLLAEADMHDQRTITQQGDIVQEGDLVQDGSMEQEGGVHSA